MHIPFNLLDPIVPYIILWLMYEDTLEVASYAAEILKSNTTKSLW